MFCFAGMSFRPSYKGTAVVVSSFIKMDSLVQVLKSS